MPRMQPGPGIHEPAIWRTRPFLHRRAALLITLVHSSMSKLTIKSDSIEAEFKRGRGRAAAIKRGYISFIKKHEAVLFLDDEVQKIVEAISTGKMAKGILKSFETRATHLESLKDRHSSITICPKCASALVLRTVKSGQKAGSQFYGCSTFPKCRYTMPVE